MVLRLRGPLHFCWQPPKVILVPLTNQNVHIITIETQFPKRPRHGQATIRRPMQRPPFSFFQQFESCYLNYHRFLAGRLGLGTIGEACSNSGYQHA
jgi:hypothetical protein